MVSEVKVGARNPARIKNLLVKELVENWQGLQSFVVVCPVGLDVITSNQLRAALHAKKIKMMVVRNSLARLALAELDMAVAAELLDTPSAICYGGESVVDVAREMVDFARKVDVFSVRGAFVEGQVFSVEQVRKLATMPNKAELSAQIVCLVLSPGRGIASALLSPAGRIAGAVEALVEKLGSQAHPADASESATAESTESTEPAESQDATAEKQDATESASDSATDQQQSSDQQ
ncbi:MAG: 50S ribosomal protein L10 [Actinobacteria bacterium]|nr:50S ribosomal protein L10 [Actinomycetota bacterium]